MLIFSLKVPDLNENTHERWTIHVSSAGQGHSLPLDSHLGYGSIHAAWGKRGGCGWYIPYKQANLTWAAWIWTECVFIRTQECYLSNRIFSLFLYQKFWLLSLTLALLLCALTHSLWGPYALTEYCFWLNNYPYLHTRCTVHDHLIDTLCKYNTVLQRKSLT